MSTHKSIDKICTIIVVVTFLISIVFCNAQAFGVQTVAYAAGYTNRIFDNSKVHTMDIVMDDWDGFLETCTSEEYSSCNLIIDGESIKNVAIRGKGNTSLSSVQNMDSSRYSFKVEFDHYNSGKTYHGLDKLCLNNIIQDNTYMKDYLAYTLTEGFGVDTPLCSYVYITVNGKDWGLYLAVEAIEEAFLERNYGSNYGDLYKPDSMSMGGGGPGNGKDFNMDDFKNQNNDSSENTDTEDNGQQGMPNGFGGQGMPDFSQGMPDDMKMPEDFDFSDFDPSEQFGGGNGMKGFGGMGSDDVKLNYIDDDIDSYPNIFNSAKTNVTTADKKRLISSLKALSEQSEIESTVDTDEVLRYFVVHNFLCNGDSYTGAMIHNYYLYEKDGQLSMIPWDYNLAYGSFQNSNATSSVNTPIDTPVSGDMSDRPMISWIFDDESYTEQYHELMSEFVDQTDFTSMVNDTAEMIDSYVQKDPTKFCTYEEFQTGVSSMQTFCNLRAESIQGQLDGTIPSTSNGQSEDDTALIDASKLNISDLGTMNMGGMGGKGMPGGDFKDKSQGNQESSDSDTDSNANIIKTNNITTQSQNGGNGNPPGNFGGEMPEGFDPSSMPEGFDPSSMPQGNPPQGFDGNIPEGFTPPDNQNASQISQDENQTSEDENQTSEDENQNNHNGKAPGNMPQMNNASGGSSQTSSTTSLILLCVSAGVLAVGIFVALKFKR